MKKIIVLGMLAVLLTFGLVLMSCGGCPSSGDCDVAKGKFCVAKDAGDVETVANCAAYKAAMANKTSGKCDC